MGESSTIKTRSGPGVVMKREANQTLRLTVRFDNQLKESLRVP